VRRFWSALARSQPAFDHPSDLGKKAIVAERPADAFGCAQT
jgi:hypothetical protein